ncbi:hypothetical protein G6F35_018582 [Rhizopus arrhizus]|nr:hypothetical protein G6F35_018582 [Rhizopus arrhizus]
MEERARQRRKDGGPAQQAEQRIDQRVLNVVNRRIVLMQVVPGNEFHRHRLGRPRQAQIRAQQGRGRRPRGRALPRAPR